MYFIAGASILLCYRIRRDGDLRCVNLDSKLSLTKLYIAKTGPGFWEPSWFNGPRPDDVRNWSFGNPGASNGPKLENGQKIHESPSIMLTTITIALLIRKIAFVKGGRDD